VQLAVTPWTADDIPDIMNYFLEAEEGHLSGMGADAAKLPSFESWHTSLMTEYHKPALEQGYYYVIWMCDGERVGHCNINFIEHGIQANMHLHMWESGQRRKGMGTKLVQLALPLFFERFNLKKVICEPYALNPAPNKTLPRAGFQFVRKYRCTPGPINFEQEVSRWEILREAVVAS